LRGRSPRALTTGNLQLIRAAAAELSRVDLGDALPVCMAFPTPSPSVLSEPRFDGSIDTPSRRRQPVAEVSAAVDAFAAMVVQPEDALLALQRLL
jgi:hypothetical protein